MASPRLTAVVAALVTIAISSGLRGAACEERVTRPALVPAPQKITLASGSVRLVPGWSIIIEDSANDAAAAQLISREIAARLGWTPTSARDTAAANAIVLSRSPVRVPAFSRQAYGLSIRPGRIVIRGRDAQGRFYGAQTLRQLIRTSYDGSLPCLDILDWPAMGWRGVTDDVSGGQMPRARDLRELMDMLAYYKVNLYCIDLSDALTSSPDSTRGITAAELAELTTEADRNHIRVLPMVQSLGVRRKLVEALERQGPRRLWSLLPRGNPPWPFAPWARGACVGDLDAVADAVSSPWFHVGGDDLGTLGVSSPQAAGVAVDGTTHAELLRFLGDRLHRDHQRQTFVYSGFLNRFPGLLDSLDRHTAIVDQGREPQGTPASIRRYLAAGFRDVFVAPDLCNANAPYPNYARGLVNVQAAVDSGKAAGAVGAITSAGGHGSAGLRENICLGYAYSAAAAWQATSPPIADFFGDFVHVQYGVDGTEIGSVLRLLALRDARELDDLARALSRIPHVRRCGAAWRAEMTALLTDMNTTLKLIDRAAPRLPQAADQVHALRNAAEHYRYLAERELFMDEIAASLQDHGPNAQGRAARRLQWLRGRVRNLMRDDVQLWLSRNKRDRLEENLATLDGQVREVTAMTAAAWAGELCVWNVGQPAYTRTRWAERNETRPGGLAAFVPGAFTGMGAPLFVPADPTPRETETVMFETNRWDLYPRHADLCIKTLTQRQDGPGVMVSLQNDVRDFEYYHYTIQRDSQRAEPHDSRAGFIAVDFDTTGSRPRRVVIQVQAVASRGRRTPMYSLEFAFCPSGLYADAGRGAPNWMVMKISDLALCGSSVEDWIVDRPSAEDRAYARRRWGPLVASLRTDSEKAQAIARELARSLQAHQGIPSNAMDRLPPLQQLTRAESGVDHVWCANYAGIFSAACNALDIQVRRINMQYVWSSAGNTNFEIGEGHETTEVFDRDINHWIWMDVTLGILGAHVDKLDPVNLADLVRILNDERRRSRLYVLEYDATSGTESTVPVLECRRWRDMLSFFRKDQRYQYLRVAPRSGS